MGRAQVVQAEAAGPSFCPYESGPFETYHGHSSQVIVNGRCLAI